MLLPSKHLASPSILFYFHFTAGGRGHICNVCLLIRISQCCSRGQRKTWELVSPAWLALARPLPHFSLSSLELAVLLDWSQRGLTLSRVCQSPPPPCTGLTNAHATSELRGCLLRIPRLNGFAVLAAEATTHHMVGCSPLPWLHPLQPFAVYTLSGTSL